MEHPAWLFEPRSEILYRPLDKTPLTWVVTLKQLNVLVALLDQQTEFAVDLEVCSRKRIPFPIMF